LNDTTWSRHRVDGARRYESGDLMPAEDKKSLLMSLGLPEEVADAAIASDGDGFRDGASRVSMFYSLKVNDDAKAAWKAHYFNYTKGAKASKGHVNVSHSYNEETREVICSCASVPSSSGSGCLLESSDPPRTPSPRPRLSCAGIETITGKDAMSNHIGNCLPHYAQMLGCGVVMKEIICVCDPAEMDWFKESLSAWQAERLIVTPDHCP
jgi:hypothetical protein